jgi:hypothetical protein
MVVVVQFGDSGRRSAILLQGSTNYIVS